MGLVFHAGRWYLAAHDDRTDEIRTFRVDRVRRAEARPERAVVPEGFDAAGHVARSIAQAPWGWEIEVVLETTLQEARRRIPRTIGDPKEIDGGVLLRAQSDDLDAAARKLARVGWPFTVRRPPELRAAVRKLDVVLQGAIGHASANEGPRTPARRASTCLPATATRRKRCQLGRVGGAAPITSHATSDRQRPAPGRQGR